MSDNRNEPIDQYGRNLAAYAYPRADEVSGLPTAFRRKWVLRLSVVLPVGGALEDIVRSLELSVRRDIAEALGVDNLEEPVPSVSAVRLDDHHLVLEIDCPSPAAGMGDAAVIATFGILKGADRQWQLEDLQGIPKRFWFALDP